MKSFADLNIKTKRKILIGDKVKILDILNEEIIVQDYKIETSKYGKNKSGKCLYLQIVHEYKNKVIFTGSDILIELMEQVKDEDLPFKTKIIKESEYYIFK